MLTPHFMRALFMKQRVSRLLAKRPACSAPSSLQSSRGAFVPYYQCRRASRRSYRFSQHQSVRSSPLLSLQSRLHTVVGASAASHDENAVESSLHRDDAQNVSRPCSPTFRELGVMEPISLALAELRLKHASDIQQRALPHLLSTSTGLTQSSNDSTATTATSSAHQSTSALIAAETGSGKV